MNSNRLFSKGRRADFRREIAWFTMYLMLFLFLIPVAYLFGREGALGYGNVVAAAEKHRLLYNYAIEILGMGFSTTVVLIGAGFLEAYHQFGYLHRRREIDFYHAMPCTRRQLFFTRFANGIGTVLLPYLCGTLAGLASAVLTGLTFRELLQPLGAALLLNSLSFLLTYTVAILAVMLTGRALTGILGMAVLTGYFPFLTLLLTSIPSNWYATYHSDPQSGLLVRLGELSPVMQAVQYALTFHDRYKMPFGYNSMTAGFIFRVLMGFAAILLLMLLNLKLYDIRPLEKAGDAMVFRKTEPVIRILLVVLAGISVMQFMKAINGSLGWIVFFTLAAVVIGHVIIELIYYADPRKVLRHRIELGVLLIAFMAFILCVHFDLTGYDRYLPKEDRIESAELHFNSYGDVYTIWQVDSGGEVYSSWSQGPEYWEDTENMPVTEGLYKEADEIAAVRSITEKGYAYMEKEGMLDSDYMDNPFPDETARSFSVVWHLKGGRKVSRSYTVSMTDIHDDYETLFDSETGRTYMYPILAMQPAGSGDLWYEENGEVLRIEDKNAADRILDAYLMDLRAMTMADIEGKTPAALLRIGISPEVLRSLGLDDMAESMENARANQFKYGGSVFFRYPIYDCFENTLAALAAQEIRPGTLPGSTENITAFNCGGWGMNQNGEETWFSGEVENAEDLALIRENLVLSDYTHYNEYGPHTIGDIEITWSANDRNYTGCLLQNEETERFTDRMFREHFLSRR